MTAANNEIAVRDLAPTELDAAVAVLARGMRDNPLHVAAYGTDPERRLRCHTRLMRGVLTIFDTMQPICAICDGTLVAVTGVAPARTCQPTSAQRLRMLPVVAGLGPLTAARVLAWTSAWTKRDPNEPHVHLGPLAVDTHLQRRGIGSLIMTEFCRRLDIDGAIGYLETDKDTNVAFYQRFGFGVVDDAPVLGVPNWFMRRPPSQPPMP